MNCDLTPFTQHALVALILGSLLACGGGATDQSVSKASKIIYTPPTSGDYRFLRNATQSTDTHLVLDLVGPTGTAGRGVAFFLSTDASKLGWAKVVDSDAEYAQSPAFSRGALLSILKSKASSGELQVGAFIRGTQDFPVTFDASVILASVALDLKPGAPTGIAPLTATNGKSVMLPSTVAEAPLAIVITPGTVALQ